MNTAEKFFDSAEVQQYALDLSKYPYEVNSYCFDSDSLVSALKRNHFKARGLGKVVTAYILENITSASWTATLLEELCPASKPFTWTKLHGEPKEANMSTLLNERKNVYFQH